MTPIDSPALQALERIADGRTVASTMMRRLIARKLVSGDGITEKGSDVIASAYARRSRLELALLTACEAHR
jgi:hypothetical protein